MNLLAASIQVWANVKIIEKVPAKYFNPPPEVDSAVIRLETRIQNLESSSIENYYRLIKALFKQPRKTILNNLSAIYREPFSYSKYENGSPKISGLTKPEIVEKLKKIGINPSDRPQNLTIEQLTLLADVFE